MNSSSRKNHGCGISENGHETLDQIIKIIQRQKSTFFTGIGTGIAVRSKKSGLYSRIHKPLRIVLFQNFVIECFRPGRK